MRPGVTTNRENLSPLTHPVPASVSVIICAYTMNRWDDLVAAVGSMGDQTVAPREIILVIDHNTELLERSREVFTGAIVIENHHEKGLSGARNSGLDAASSEVIAFMDEDARAEPDWLEKLLGGYANPDVMGVGGAILPDWIAAKPAWFPEEFLWVVGCSYRGMPETKAYVRNLIGTNMSFRREIVTEFGGFRSALGRMNSLPFGCEETEWCIRAGQLKPEQKFLYLSQARVLHHVPARRGTLAYFLSRCYAEGISKATVSRMVGAGDGLSSERHYVLRTLPAGIWRGLRDGITGQVAGFGRSAAILAGLAITGFGYLVGRASGGLFPVRLKSAPPVSVRPEGRSAALPSGVSPDRWPGYQKARPRILMVTPFFFPHEGGTEKHVYEVSRRIARDYGDVTILTVNYTRQLPESEDLDGVHIVRLPAWFTKGDYLLAPSLYAFVRQGNWDLVHIQSYHTLVPPLAMAAALHSHIPYVVTFHGGGHTSRLRNQLRSFQRKSLGHWLRNAERLIAVANFEISLFGQELNVPSSRFSLIPNGCDLPVQPTATIERQNAFVVSVGRLEQYKGHHRLIAAMPEIAEELPDARLWIAGRGPEEAKLRRQISQLGLDQRVDIRAIPMVDHQTMAEELSRASLFVLLSEFETHPIAALEAIALGIPALVADSSGLRELAENGLARSIPLESSPHHVAQNIIELLNTPPAPPVVHLPTWDDCARDLTAVYKDILFASYGDSYAHSHAHPILSADHGRN